MKQEMISYLSTCHEELSKLNNYLYNNPENSYDEFKACDYITNFLKNHDFTIENNFLDLQTSFYATKGSGYPKVCFLCEYDAVPGEGHFTGHNLLTTISLGASISLGKVIDKIGGTIIVIGCPGEYLGGTKSVMVKQGVFEDIDVVLAAHPDVITCESDKEYLIKCYNNAVDIAKKYGWINIKCTEGNSLRTIEHINEEVYRKVQQIV